MCGQVPCTCCCFHGLYAVAPLKRERRSGCPRSSRGFPRPLRRGPIEAFGVRRLVERLSAFPRPLRRGPIEAHRFGCKYSSLISFHGLYAVAPLKLQRFPTVTHSLPSFHGLYAVAPLKHLEHLRDHRRKPAGFHGLYAVAPLKLMQLSQLCRADVSFPRPLRRGPIEASS